MANKNVKTIDDEALVKLAKEGDSKAEEAILSSYKQSVRTIAGRYFIEGAEAEDLVQEGMIGLVKAIRSFDESAGASFKTFAALAVERQIQDAVKAASRKKHKPLNAAISLDHPVGEDDDTTLADILDAGDAQNPESKLLLSELLNAVLNPKIASFSAFEKQVIKLLAQGKSYRQIADLTGKTPKQTDNAIQRIRSKLKKHFSD